MRIVVLKQRSKAVFYLLLFSSFASLFILNACQPTKEESKEGTASSNAEVAEKFVMILNPGTELMETPQGAVIVWLPGGEQVTVLESSPQMVEYKSRKNYWYRVKTKSGREGWVWGDDFAFAKDDTSKDLQITKTDLGRMSAQELIELGNGFLQNERPSEALPYFIRATEIAPADSLAFFLLGLTYQQLGQDEKSVEPYQQAIKLAPKDFWAHNNLGLAYIRTKQYEKAVEVLEKAVKLTPPSEMYNEVEEARVVAVRNLATAYRSLGRDAEANNLLAKQSTK
jgi:lipopolysaccharide biosynthesis regulator YciM